MHTFQFYICKKFTTQLSLLLQEDGVNLLTVIKAAGMYRRSRQRDVIMDYLPPTKSEFDKTFNQDQRYYNIRPNKAVFSTVNSTLWYCIVFNKI